MDYKCKMSLIGDENVGKTSIILRYINDTFTSQYISTLGADFIDKVYTNKDLAALPLNNTLTITVWDLGGQSSFKDISPLYCEGSAGIMIVFDVSNVESFRSVPEWIKIASESCPKSKVMIIGNKNDLKMRVNPNDIQEFEEKFGFKVHFTSAKANLNESISNINNIFENMANILLQGSL